MREKIRLAIVHVHLTILFSNYYNLVDLSKYLINSL